MEQWAVERLKVEDRVLKAWREKTPEAIEAAPQAIREWESKYPDEVSLMALRAALDR